MFSKLKTSLSVAGLVVSLGSIDAFAEQYKVKAVEGREYTVTLRLEECLETLYVPEDGRPSYCTLNPGFTPGANEILLNSRGMLIHLDFAPHYTPKEEEVLTKLQEKGFDKTFSFKTLVVE